MGCKSGVCVVSRVFVLMIFIVIMWLLVFSYNDSDSIMALRYFLRNCLGATLC